MKKLLIMLLLALMLPVAGWSRNADDIVNEFRDAHHAQYVNVGRGMLSLARIFTPGLPSAKHGITAVRALDLSDCKDGVRDKFRKRVASLRNDPTYEEMVTSDKDDSHSMVLMHNDGYYVDEIVVVSAGDGNDSIVVIRGKISLDEVERIVNDDTYYPIR